jgi:uncharacterized membrane protein YcaP (DUF421 family)
MSQFLLAILYYSLLILLLRLSGKRLAGQTTTFDLIVLISLGVVMQGITLKPGTTNAVIFVSTVFATHRLLALACARWKWLRHFVRGAPRVLVRDGVVLTQALMDEGVSYEEMLAGFRKFGIDDPAVAKLAVLEETGHITAVAIEK